MADESSDVETLRLKIKAENEQERPAAAPLAAVSKRSDIVGPTDALPEGMDVRAVRVVLSARQCLFRLLLKEARTHPSKDIEKPEVFESFLEDTRLRFQTTKLTPMSCGERLLKNVEGCLPSINGGVLGLRLECSVLSPYIEVDSYLSLPPVPPAAEGAAPDPPVKGPDEKKVAALLYSTQACANEKAYHLTASYGARLRKAGIGEGDDPEPYRAAAKKARQSLKDSRLSPLPCSNRQVKQLTYCLKSVEDLGIGAIGTPYGGEWCGEEPYASAVRME